MNSSKTPPLWHTLSDQQTAAEQAVALAQGLTPAEVEARRLQYGANRLTPRKGKSALLRFLLQFHNALVYILLAAGVATAFVKGPTDALTIFGVVLINAVIGYFQEAKAENAIAALARTLSPLSSLSPVIAPSLLMMASSCTVPSIPMICAFLG